MNRLQMYARALGLAACVALFSTAPARAADEGQADLDKAVELQLNAEAKAKEDGQLSLSDMERIADLCESALSKGLDEGNKKLAEQLLTSTLYQHGEKLSNVLFSEDLFEPKQPHPQWVQIRALAVRSLEKATKHDAKMADAHFLLARLYALPGGDKDKAAKAAKLAVENYADNPDDKARALVLMGLFETETDKQLELFSKAVETAPKNTDALRARGLYYLGKGEQDKAVADFTKLIEADADNVAALGLLTDALVAQKKFDDALKTVDKIIAAKPALAAGYVARARVNTLKGDDKAALDDLNKGLAIQADDPAALLMRASLYFKDKKIEEAKADIEKAMASRPGLVQGMVMKAALLADQGKFDDAIREIEPLAAAQPGNPDWRLQIAQYHSAAKRPRKAIDIVNEVLKQDDDNAIALRLRGDAYLSIGQHADAIADLEASLKIDPKNSGVLNNLAWVLSTSPDDKVRDGKRAIGLAQQACEITEFKRPHIISTLAAAHAEAGDWDNAVKWSTKALELSGDDDKEILDQLKDELKHYHEKKPFREKQETEEKPEKPKANPDDLEI